MSRCRAEEPVLTTVARMGHTWRWLEPIGSPSQRSASAEVAPNDEHCGSARVALIAGFVTTLVGRGRMPPG
jgi:hypothetical protein